MGYNLNMMKKNIYIVGLLLLGCLLVPSKVTPDNTPTVQITEINHPLTVEQREFLYKIVRFNAESNNMPLHKD
tara:strand:- start:274 stop:492 length:219 start_codon:yes stop_codon:yes gene_type:complete